ncbi:MAG: BON domain-containing protein [Cyanobacteriota bacterium]
MRQLPILLALLSRLQRRDEVKEARQDAENQTRQAQLESDIRAREQRNNMGLSGDKVRDDDNLASEVRGKLEANIPGSLLTVKAENGVVTVAGTVPNAEELATIDTLAKEIKGVNAVNLNVKVAPATQ